jgi:hypothetical protein
MIVTHKSLVACWFEVVDNVMAAMVPWRVADASH